MQRVVRAGDAYLGVGPEQNFTYIANLDPGIAIVTLADLQRAKNAEGERLTVLADERRYQAVRALELRNLVVPVVGDFAGPTAIRAVGAWLAARRANVGAFYVSNVERYLFQRGDGAHAFYANAATLPADSTTTFIRSVPCFPAASFAATPVVAPQYDVQVRDSGNASIVEITRYGAGGRVTTRTVDTSATRPRSALQVFRSLQPQPSVPSGPRVFRSALVSGTRRCARPCGASSRRRSRATPTSPRRRGSTARRDLTTASSRRAPHRPPRRGVARARRGARGARRARTRVLAGA